MANRARGRMAREAERRRRRQRRWLLRGVGALLVLVIGALAYQSLTKEYPGEAVPTLGNQHVSSLDPGSWPYNTRPPTSGPHLPSLARWGIHTQPISDVLQVHNLEDGGVLVQYNCHECRDLIAKLETIVSRYPDKVILAPYPNMDRPVALTAWGRIDFLDTFDEGRILRFIDAYRGIDHHPKR